MAAMAWPSLLHFLVSFCFLTSRFNLIHGVPEYTLGCGQQIDLITPGVTQTHSGVLHVGLPKDFSQFQDINNPRDCDITIMYNSGKQLLIELYYVDIIPTSNEAGCSVGLQVFDQYADIYSRVCGKAWEWEKKHRESQQEKRISRSTPVTFRLKSDGGGATGGGFKVHFNEFRPTPPCYTREFTCRDLQRCIHDDLTCDGWDDCGDRTDEEEEAGCYLLTASEICAIIIGILFVVGTVSISVVFFIHYRRQYKEYVVRSESKMPIAFDARSIPDSQISFPRRYNSQESMSKMSKAGSRNGYVIRTSVDSLDKLGSEKADRMSERSYKKNRASSDRGKSPDRDRSSRDRDRDRKSYHSGSESEDRYDDKGYRRRRSRERSRDRYSDDSDYERDRERRRRRRRRSYSDEDESDTDRDRRRRRRSYDRYSDEDSDSERERERRRRRRSRDRYSSKTDNRDEKSDREKERENEKNEVF